MAAAVGRTLLNLADSNPSTLGGASPELAPAAEPAQADFWPTQAAGLAVCGIFAWAAAAISCYQIFLHATNYEDPIVQRYFIRIIILIPNYAVCSFFSLVFEDASVYIQTARDMYEAFVIYSFLSLLLQFVGGAGNVEAFCRDKTVHGSILYGTCCFPTMQVDGQFVKLCKRLVLQFVILKPILVILTIALYAEGHYTEGDWSPGSSYMYIQIVYNFCYAAALLGLIHFWAGTRDLLKPYRPVWKFLTVKGVVFITFWQGIVLSLLFIRQSEERAKQLQTWLLCLEMLPAAIAMWFAFPAAPYMNAARNREQGGIMMAVQNVGNVVMFTDVVTDLKHQFVPQYNTYTCYKDVDDDAPDGPAPTGQYRHATYVIRDPFQEQAIAQSRQQSQNGHARGDGAGPSAPNRAPVDLFGDLQDVPLGDEAAPPAPNGATASSNPFMQDLR